MLLMLAVLQLVRLETVGVVVVDVVVVCGRLLSRGLVAAGRRLGHDPAFIEHRQASVCRARLVIRKQRR